MQREAEEEGLGMRSHNGVQGRAWPMMLHQRGLVKSCFKSVPVSSNQEDYDERGNQAKSLAHFLASAERVLAPSRAG